MNPMPNPYNSSPVDLESIAVLADRFLGWNGGRIYLKNLLTATASIKDRPRIVVILNDRNIADDVVRDADQAIIYNNEGFVARLRNRIRAHLNMGDFPPTAILRRLKPVVVFGNGLGQRIGRAAIVSNVLDYQDRYYPHLTSDTLLRKRTIQEARTARFADGIVFNSRYSLNDFADRNPTCAAVKAVVPLFVMVSPEELSKDPQAVAQKYRLPDRFFIVPSQLWEHKNHLQLLSAISILKERNIDLVAVLTGMPFDPRRPKFISELLQAVSSLGLRDRMIFLGQVDRVDLIALMRQSLGFVQPSLYEGGGLPAEEARSLGKRIVLADLPLQREANIPFTYYFTPHNPESLAVAIQSAFEDQPHGIEVLSEQNAISASVSRASEIAKSFLDLVKKAVEYRSSKIQRGQNDYKNKV
jgi:glycosyltransferase involved in cell wall biosynthesis